MHSYMEVSLWLGRNAIEIWFSFSLVFAVFQKHRFQIIEKLSVNSITYFFKLNGFKET